MLSLDTSRLETNRGTAESFSLLMDVSSMPSGSIATASVVSFYVKRTFTQPHWDLVLSSASSSQVQILDPHDPASILVELLPADTQQMVPGDYYWRLKVTAPNILQVSPVDRNGSFTVLDNAMGN